MFIVEKMDSCERKMIPDVMITINLWKDWKEYWPNPELNQQPPDLKGGHLDFAHITELKKIYITEIYMKNQYKSSIIKNHKIARKNYDCIPLKGYAAS